MIPARYKLNHAILWVAPAVAMLGAAVFGMSRSARPARIAGADHAVEQWIKYRIAGDFRDSYSLLSSRTQREISREEYISRDKYSTEHLLKPLSVHITSSRLVSPVRVEVRVSVLTRVGRVAAAALKRRGRTDIHVGLYTFHGVETALLEHGQWRIYKEVGKHPLGTLPRSTETL